jgi:Terminase large subunit, T4likevirus-type, N-terminal
VGLENLIQIKAELARRRHEGDPVQMAFDLGFRPDPWQAKLMRSQSKRILACTSRQGGKSQTAALCALHEAITKPVSLTLIVSKAMRQSRELFGKVRDSWEQLLSFAAMEGLPYQTPELELTEDNLTSLRFANMSRIVSIPASNSTIRGFSAVSLIIIDEAAFVPDELYLSVRPMLIISKGRLLMLSTPFGKRGHFYREWSGLGAKDWERYEVPATMIPEERISAEDLRAERDALDDWWFEQEYLCRFQDAIGQVFASEDIDRSVKPELEVLAL